MTFTRDIAVLVGSLRRGAFSRSTALALAERAPGALRLEIVEMGHLALYSQDLDADPPEAWTAFRDRIRRADGVLFVTPEYNRSVPAALKNAIDIGSRPYGASAWDGKPAGVVSISPGALGGFGANHHLRQSLVFLNMPVMQQPEAYLGGVGDWFDEAGRLTSERADAFLTKIIQAYGEWVEKILKGQAARSAG